MSRITTGSQWAIDHVGSHPKRLIFIAAGILTTGFFWQLVNQLLDSESDTEAFPRSGALLVMFAIATVFVNHLLGKTKSNTEAHVQKFDKPPETLDLIFRRELPKQLSWTAAGQEIHENEPRILDAIVPVVVEAIREDIEESKVKLENLNTAEINLTYTEAVAGILGTFIWGYGDLIFNVIYATFAALTAI